MTAIASIHNFLSELPFNLTPEQMNNSRIRTLLNEHFSHESDQLMSNFMEMSFIFLYVTLSILAISVNILIASIIIRKQNLRNRTNLLIVNLMLADLLLAIICMPLSLLSFIRKSWPLGSILCKLVPVAQGLSVFASSLTIAVIAIDRLLRVTSLRPQRTSRNKTLTIEVLFIWITSLILSLPQAFNQKQVQVGVPGLHEYSKCIEGADSVLTNLYSILITFIQLFIPSISLLLSYFKIKHHLRANMTNVKPTKMSNPSIPAPSLTTITRNSNSNSMFSDAEESIGDHTVEAEATVNGVTNVVVDRRFRKEMDRNKIVTNTLLMITASFVITWTPWNTISIILDFAPQIIASNEYFLEILAASHLLAMTSATLNPLLYGYWNPSIKKELIGSRQRTVSV